MTIHTINYDDETPINISHDIISQQRAAGMSESLMRMQVSPTAIAAGHIKPQRYLDGMVLAEGTMNLVSLDGASGKSTSSRAAGISAAATGLWTMLGTRQHGTPLRVAMLHGEETGEQISQSIMSIPGAYDQYLEAIGTGRLLIVSMLDYAAKANRSESMFDRDGRLTASGSAIFRDLAAFRPDVLILDTLGSLSDSEYLDGLSPRNTLNTLNNFCARQRCTGIAYLHLTKDAGGEITADSVASELLALSRGSAMLKNVARSFVVATRAPTGMYPGIEVGAGDEIWIGTTKCNLQNAKYNNQIFPIVRDSSRMILTAYSVDGSKALADEADMASKSAFRALIDYLPHLIRAASDLCKPFPTSARNRFALQTMLTGPMSGFFAEKMNSSLISSALDTLLKDGKIVECSDTRAAGAMVYCTPGGIFADPGSYKAATGEDPKIRKGDYPVDDLRELMHELHDAARNGEPIQTMGAALAGYGDED